MNMAIRTIVGSLLLALGMTTLVLAAPGDPQASPLHYNAGTGYYDPPSYNSMVMVNIAFDGYNLSWEPASYDFAVGPVLGAAPPNGSKSTFDPAQPWSVLNGTAFNRQLGWYDNVDDDFYLVHRNPDDYSLYGQPPLPGAYSVWIEKILVSSPELKTYSVSEDGNSNGPYSPIFGTAGSPTKWRWDGFMDHNANAVSLSDLKTPSQVFTAVYKLYIGDSGGNEVLNPDHVTPLYGSTTVTWRWIGPAVLPTNSPPTVVAVADAAEVPETWVANLHAAGHDPDSDVLTYTWTQTAGKTVLLSGANTADASVTAPTVNSIPEASLTFLLSVSDGRGGTASKTVNVRVRILGDTNADDRVNVLDLLYVADAFGTHLGDARYNPAYDFNKDGTVNALDLLDLAHSFGRANAP